MKRLSRGVFVTLGLLAPLTFSRGQGSATTSAVLPSGPQEADTIVIQIVADADSVMAMPISVTGQPGSVLGILPSSSR